MSSQKQSEAQETTSAQLLKEAHATLDEIEGCVRHLPPGSQSTGELTDLILKLRMQLTKEVDKTTKGAS